jgi:tripartite-type tricarboxylate transporter receptor subunit TctC
MSLRTVSAFAAAIAVGAASGAATAQSDTVAEFYKGKTVTVVSAGSAGGAHGVYAQLITAHIKKHLPGDPTIIIQYMPGAGGNKAMNYLFNATRDDGTYLGVPLQDLVFSARIGVKAVKYDPTKAHYLGGADVTRTTVTVMKASGIDSLEEARQKEVLMGASGKSAQPYMIPIVLNEVLGTKFRVVTGYAGINGMHLAMERGEVHGRATSWQSITSTKKAWIENGMIVNLLTVAMEREPDLPDVPALAELVTKPDDVALIRLLAGSSVHGRAWIAWGGIPAERLAALRTAFGKTMSDPAFKADAEKRGLELRPVSWREQEQRKNEMMATPPATVARLKSILSLN